MAIFYITVFAIIVWCLIMLHSIRIGDKTVMQARIENIIYNWLRKHCKEDKPGVYILTVNDFDIEPLVKEIISIKRRINVTEKE